ncbi:MAG: 50S ribosomal protein L37ae [Candidatus Altiarchaeota archaeon]
MYSHTKKVGSVGRYGTRVGWKTRKQVARIEDDSRKSRNCPSCGKNSVKRSSAGIWNCPSCKTTFSGGAFIATPKRKKQEESK